MKGEEHAGGDEVPIRKLDGGVREELHNFPPTKKKKKKNPNPLRQSEKTDTEKVRCGKGRRTSRGGGLQGSRNHGGRRKTGKYLQREKKCSLHWERSKNERNSF